MQGRLAAPDQGVGGETHLLHRQVKMQYVLLAHETLSDQLSLADDPDLIWSDGPRSGILITLVNPPTRSTGFLF